MISGVILVVASLVAILVFTGLRRTLTSVTALYLLAGLLFMAGGATFLYFQQIALDAIRVIQGWPQINGRVIDSRIIGTRAIRPNIVYEYTVNGREYRDSSSLDTPPFGARATKYGEADTLVALYPIGKEITIHYNPEQPSQSRLRVSPPWNLFGKMGLGALLYALGLFAVLGFIFRRK